MHELKLIIMKKMLLALLFLNCLFAQGLIAQDLAAADEKTALYMIEEEKMARDVYDAFEAKWGATIFNHISEAEGRHYERMLALARSIGVKVPDAIEKNDAGRFMNEELQAMYDAFITSGNQSLAAALQVGGVLEETNYRDLSAGIEATGNEEVRATFTQLLNASANHLRAFNRNLATEGVSYRPTVLPQEDFDAVIAGTAQVKGQGRGKGQGCQEQGAGKGYCQKSAAAEHGKGAGCQGGKGQGKGCKAKSK